MDLGIMQPYFFPYLGYFDLILKTKHWIVFDVVNYRPRHWMNRNRIMEAVKGEQYITVPIDKRSGRRLDEIEVKGLTAAKDKILGQLHVYYNKAPYYEETRELVVTAFDSSSSSLLRDLNIETLKASCARLGINFDYQIVSSMQLDLTNVKHAGQWALEICRQLNASSYLNPPGGKDIFIPEEWQARNIKLHFTKPPEFSYPTHPKLPFKPHLSIIDVFMWNEPSAIMDFLSQWDIAG